MPTRNRWKSSPLNLGWPEAVLLFILTGLAYLGSYLYELGYFRYFGLPSCFISVSTEEMIRSCLGVLLLVFLALFMFLIGSEPEADSSKRPQTKIVFSAVVFGLVTSFWLVETCFGFGPLVAAGCFFALLIFMSALYRVAHKRSLRAIKGSVSGPVKTFLMLVGTLPKPYIYLSAFAGFSLAFFFLSGAFVARYTEHFLVIKKQQMAIIKSCPKFFLCKKYENGRISDKGFTYLTVDDVHNQEITTEILQFVR